MDINQIRQDFPILSEKINNKNLIYFDNAATSQKPQIMINKLIEYYSKLNSNIHRGVHTLSQKATEEFENVRSLIAQIYGSKYQEVIFTKNDTESLNLISKTLGNQLLKQNPTGNIVISEFEHHSNIVPWQILMRENNIDPKNNNQIRYLEFDQNGDIDTDQLDKLIDKNTLIFSLTWASNTFGYVYDLEKIINKVKNINKSTIIIVDAAQYVPHKLFNFNELNIDFITFSAHKVFGPTGVGVLIGKEDLLNSMPVFLGGGDMIKEVDYFESSYNSLPYKFEAGTPNIADVIAFGETLKYLNNLGWDNIEHQEIKLTKKLLKELNKLNFVEIYGYEDYAKNKLPLVSFNLKNIHPHDVGSILDDDGIAIRTGHHCTQLIMKKLKIPASCRASLAFYNTEEEIDIFINSLIKVNKIFQ